MPDRHRRRDFIKKPRSNENLDDLGPLVNHETHGVIETETRESFQASIWTDTDPVTSFVTNRYRPMLTNWADRTDEELHRILLQRYYLEQNLRQLAEWRNRHAVERHSESTPTQSRDQGNNDEAGSVAIIETGDNGVVDQPKKGSEGSEEIKEEEETSTSPKRAKQWWHR